MALAGNPHRFPWWGFCFPACRTSPSVLQLLHQHRLAGILRVIRPMLEQHHARLFRTFIGMYRHARPYRGRE
jgi:hypothetical protein